MRRRRMAAISVSVGDPPRLSLQSSRSTTRHHHSVIVEEIEGLISVHKDGHVERFPLVPEAPCKWSPDPGAVVSRDVAVDPRRRLWARLYAPPPEIHRRRGKQLPALVYFHGGGFCVGSAAWTCYHEFLEKLSSLAGCLVMSVNYRLAPEHRLPAAFDDGVAAVKWLRQQAAASGGHDESCRWWWGRCDLGRVFVGGDSAGGAIAHHVAARIASARTSPPPISLSGVVLLQPFFGGEARTASEKDAIQPPGSALSLTAADAYWRMALPPGANRDHPWCNPLAGDGAAKLEGLRLPPYLVCVAEMDILRDRGAEFCGAMRRAGKSVAVAVHAGVGHAFQVLGTTPASLSRTEEMMSQLDAFLGR